MNGITRKVEDAIAGYLTETLPSANVYKAIDAAYAGGAVRVPAVIVLATRSRPISALIDATSGATNRYVSVAVSVRTSPDHERAEDGTQQTSSRDAHDTLSGAVMDALYVDTLPALLNGVGIAGVDIEQVDLPVESIAVDGGHIVTTLTFDVLAHGTQG